MPDPQQQQQQQQGGGQKIVAPGIGEYELTGEGTAPPPSIAGRVGHLLMNPEVVSGAASLIPGVGTLAGGGIGAGTSIARDLVEGERDPMTIGGHALEHGALGMIPGGVGKLMEKGASALMPAAEGAVALAGGSRVAALGRMLKGAIGMGEAAPAAKAAATGGADLLSMELPGGVKVASSAGLKQLVQKSIELENSGAPQRTVQALDALIQQVQQHLATAATEPANVLGNAGLQFSTAATRAEQAASAAAAATKQKAGTIANRLRLLIGAGSATKDAAGY